MEHTTLGDTGMTVSEICLGCMGFSETGEGWKLDRGESRAVIERAIDLGIDFFDTANVYSDGESERILGDVLADYDRDEQIVATKVRFPVEDHPNAAGLSRKTIEQELADSLDRLGMDTVDLYQIHRWDDDTPIEETLRALDDAVRRNQVRYLGASSMWAHQFAEALATSDALGLERFVSMQNQYNLAYCEDERELLPLCRREGVGVIPWGPLGMGYLTRPHEEMEATERGEEITIYHPEYPKRGGREINERVEELAAEKGVSMAQIALAWMLHKDWVTAPIVGVSSIEHLEDPVEAVEVDLSAGEQAYLEEPYEPVRVEKIEPVLPVEEHTVE